MPLIDRNGTATYAGLILADRERNGYDDSDFYAVVWSPESRRPRTVVYDSTRYAASGIRCEIDATPDVRAAYGVWLARERSVLAAYRAAEDAEQPRRGARVVVARGRKVPVGTVGAITWIGDGYRRGTTRLGITTDSGERVYTDAGNVDPIAQCVTGLEVIGASLARAGWLALCRQRLEADGRCDDGAEVLRAADVEMRRAERGMWARIAANADAAAVSAIAR